MNKATTLEKAQRAYRLSEWKGAVFGDPKAPFSKELEMFLRDKRLRSDFFMAMKRWQEWKIRAFKRTLRELKNADPEREPYRAAQYFTISMLVSEWENSIMESRFLVDVLETMNKHIMEQRMILRELAKGLDPSQFKARKIKSARDRIDQQDREMRIATRLLKQRLQRSDKISKWWEKRFTELQQSGSGTV